MVTTSRSVFFDIDGTLLDTTYLHSLAWWHALEDAGHRRPMAEIHSLIGMGGRELLTTLLGFHDDSIQEAHGRYFDAMHEMVRPFPGARETLRRVAEEGGNVVLVSSSSGRDLEFLVGTIGCEDIIRDVVHGDMADASKPSPDLFSLALERSGTAPEDVLALGDAIWDVNAAASAGIDCVALESGGTDQSRLQWAGALAVYRGCSELLGRWATSPIADLLRSGHRKTAYSNLNAWPTTSRIRIR